MKRITIIPSIDPPPRVCFNCWRKGHTGSSCLKAPTQEFFRNCGRRGVDLYSRPRCSEAHARWEVGQFGRKRRGYPTEPPRQKCDRGAKLEVIGAEEIREVPEALDQSELVALIVVQQPSVVGKEEAKGRGRGERESILYICDMGMKGIATGEGE